ncbi:hypothetical protein M5K25_025838 [Dendrobium thyrsiflorum]|uniref:BSD2 cysteine rich domain-containing protein n=1 Tax=Dendrobium thyrsiflorum TaxID=117978 RepID=A0ABD0TWA4_DENTH
MINAGCFACANSILISHPTKSSIASPYFPISKSKISFQSHNARKPSTACSPNSNIQSFRVNAAGFNPSTKPNSIVCSDCDGNGAILCTQCKGTGVNSVDHFNGQFKAGELCWLCSFRSEKRIKSMRPIRYMSLQVFLSFCLLIILLYLEVGR